jgi:predicted Zn-dependent protease
MSSNLLLATFLALCEFTFLSVCARANERLDALQARLESAVRSNPESVSFNLSLAAVYLKLGQPDRALPFATTAVQREPSNQIAMLTLADALLESGRSAEAFPKFYDLLISLDSKSHIADQIWFGLAKSALDISRQSARRLQVTSSAKKFWEELQRIHAQRAVAGAKILDGDRALSLLRDKRQLPEIEFQRTLIFEELGDDAIDHLLRNPTNAERLSLAADAFVWVKDYPKAIEILTKAIQLEPGSGRLWAMIGRAQWLNIDFSGAAKSLSKAIALNAGDAETNFMMGDLLSRRGNPRESIHYLQASLESNPYSVAAHSSLARAYLQTGDYRSAVHELLAIPETERTAPILYQLYRAYVKTGNSGEAQAALHEFNHLKSFRVPSLQQKTTLIGEN